MRPDLRRELAQQSFEEKIRKVGQLIALSRKVKGSAFPGSRSAVNQRAAEHDTDSLPLTRAREEVRDSRTISTRTPSVS